MLGNCMSKSSVQVELIGRILANLRVGSVLDRGSDCRRAAPIKLHEAITYLRKWHPELDILRVEFFAMIEIVSSSPLN